MLPLKKIYIDSRDRTADSKSSSSFKIELPYTVEIPDNTVFFVTDVCIPNVWQTIETNFNDRLYVCLSAPSGVLPVQQAINTNYYNIVQLSQGNYTLPALANEIQTQFRTIVNSMSYNPGVTFNVTYDALKNSLTITLSGSNCKFKLLTDYEAQQKLDHVTLSQITWNGASFDPNNLRSANGVLSFVDQVNLSTSWTSGFVNMNHINNIYITSPNLGSFDTLASFSNNIIKKVPVTGNY